jgi:TonB-dependent starch-binding outer membrane protein SusC
MKRILNTLFIMFLGIGFAFSQQQVSGRVQDMTTREPLPGVNIRIQGTSTGTVTDLDGQYRLMAAANDVLVFTFVGYISEEVPVNGQSTINLMLAPDIQLLSEFVVVGYGTQRKSDLTGSVAAINAEELRNIPAAGVDRALQGRVAGVTINANGGAPGSATSIRIRGMGSIYASNEPLFVVDGIPLAPNSRLENMVNVNDIERIDVLKDASAAAIYGSRGANGVILVTTRKGQAGTPKISFNSYYGTQNPVKEPQLASAEEYVRMAKIAHQNGGRALPAFVNAREEGQWGEGTNWWNEIMRDGGGSMQNHDFNISGGTNDFVYSSSIGYYNHKGYIKHSEFDRVNFSLNTEYKFMNYFKAGTLLRYTNTQSRGVSENDNEGGAIAQAYQIDPTIAKWKTYQELVQTANAGFDTTLTLNRYSPINSTSNSNIARSLEQNNGVTKRNNAFGTLFLEGTFFRNLTLRSEYNIDVRRMDYYNYLPIFFSSANEQQELSRVDRNYGLTNNWVHNNTATWAQTAGRHSFSLMGGFVREYFSYENINALGRQTPSNDPTYWYISSTEGAREVHGGANRNTLMSYLGRAFYSFDNRYMFTANVRRDGTSKFSKLNNNRWGTFPSISGGWNLHNENFFRALNLDWVTTMKFRASWGRIGNQAISDNAYIGKLISTYTDRYAFGPNEDFYTAYRPSNNANPNVRWETQETTNFGADMEFFRGKFQLTSDYFIRTTIDNLLFMPQPMYSGTPSYWANAGQIENRGLEFTARLMNHDRAFKYSVGGNITFLKNEVQNLGPGVDFLLSPASGRIGGSISNSIVGQPIGMFWGYKILGVFQNQEEVDNYVNDAGQKIQPRAKPGDFIFADLGGAFDENGNPIGDGRINDSDRAITGNPHPKTVFGGNINMSYAGFSLDIFLQGQYGNDIFMMQRFYNYKGYQDRFNQMAGLEKTFWNGEGSTNTNPILNPFSQNQNYRISNWWLSDGSYVRIKNVTFSYDIPHRWLTRAGIDGLTVYVTGENLLTFTNYEGLDPELGSAGDQGLELQVDRYLYPVARTFLTGVRLRL